MLASSLPARLGAAVLVSALAGGATVVSAAAAHAGRPAPSSRLADQSVGDHTFAAQIARNRQQARAATQKQADERAAVAHARAEAGKVLAVATRLRGRPYVWGAAGPHAFDCSGLVQYVFRRALGKHLPRSTWAQWASIAHIKRGQVKPGDLVFSHNLGHVGIYAGKGYWWEAPHTGSHVKKRLIWAHHARFGRVIHRG